MYRAALLNQLSVIKHLTWIGRVIFIGASVLFQLTQQLEAHKRQLSEMAARHSEDGAAAATNQRETMRKELEKVGSTLCVRVHIANHTNTHYAYNT